MSYQSNYNLNIRISYLESVIASIVPFLPINLANTLLGGNSAGGSNIDMNLNDIRNINQLEMVDGVNPNRYITTTSNPATTIDTTSSIAPGSNLIPFSSTTAGVNQSLLVDDVGLQFTYDASLKQLACKQINADYQSVNTASALTHYLGFFDSSATGYGRAQKIAGISCVPSTASITATTFNGALNGNASTATTATNANNVLITSVNSATTYYLAFTASVGGTSANQQFYIDDTTGPLTYQPSTNNIQISQPGSTINISPTRISLSNLIGTPTFAGGTLTVPLNASNMFQSYLYTMTANITAFSFGTGFLRGGEYHLFITGNAVSNFTIAVGSGTVFTEWSAPLSILATRRTLIIIRTDGTNYFLTGGTLYTP